MIWSKPRERTRFLRFAVVGAIGTVVDFGTYTLLNDLIGVPEVPASVVSFCVAVLNNFTWNRLWTYPDSRSKPLLRQVTEFTIVSVIGLIIRTPIFALLVNPLDRFLARVQVPFIPAYLLGDKIALAIAIVIVLFWNFFANRYWTYGDVQ
jgi:putative flippase GtrA